MDQILLALSASFSADRQQRKAAERFLLDYQNVSSYGLLLLEIISQPQVELQQRQAASIALKNMIEKKWKLPPQEGGATTEADRAMIKTRITEVLFMAPSLVQAQLVKAISLIGAYDFPANWQSLLPQLVARMDSDYSTVYTVLQALQGLTEKYETSFASDSLILEIQYVLDLFAPKFSQFTLGLWQSIQTISSNDPAAQAVALPFGIPNHADVLPDLFQILGCSIQLFYSLNFQDLPAFFEENLDKWMVLFMDVLNYSHPRLETQDTYDAGSLIPVKTTVCEILYLYASKYDEEDLGFRKYFLDFIQCTWTLLTTTAKTHQKFDALVSSAMRFLSSLAQKAACRSVFSAKGDLERIFEGVIMPNMALRPEDEETFESEPDEYIAIDLEGADLETRRRGASDLLKSLRVLFNEVLSPLTIQYIQMLLAQARESPERNWKSKDTAIYLVNSISITSSNFTSGASATNELIPVNQFFAQEILPILQDENVTVYPVLRASALKFVSLFRNQLTDAELNAVLHPAIRHLGAPSKVVCTYAAFLVDRLLCTRMRSAGTDLRQLAMGISRAAAPLTLRIMPADIEPRLGEIFSLAFSSLTRPGNTDNVYVIKCILRVMTFLKSKLCYIEQLVDQLAKKLASILTNPPNPDFTYNLFEATAATIRYGFQGDQNRLVFFETALLPVFQQMLQGNVVEFQPYLLQILARLLKLRSGPIPPHYAMLLDPILTSELFEIKANVPGLTMLLQTMMVKDVSGEHFTPARVDKIVQISQKMASDKLMDDFGVSLLISVTCFLPPSVFETRAAGIIQALLMRLTREKTAKFVRLFLTLFSAMFARHGSKCTQEIVDGFQPGLFRNILELYRGPNLPGTSPENRKALALGLTSILCHCPPMLSTYREYWMPMLGVLLKVLDPLQLRDEGDDVSDFDDDEFGNREENSEFHASFASLVNAECKYFDPFAGVQDEKLAFLAAFNQLSTAFPDIRQFVESQLDDTLRPPYNALLAYKQQQ